MPFLNRLAKVTRLMEFSANGKKKQPKNLSYRILVIISIALLRSSYFNFLRKISDTANLNKFFSNAFFKSTRKSYSFHGYFRKWGEMSWKSSIQVFRHYFICIATVKLPQFLTFNSDHSVFNKSYSNAFFKLIPESYSFQGNFRNC